MDLEGFTFRTTVDLVVESVMIAADIECAVRVEGDWMDWDDDPQWWIESITVDDVQHTARRKLTLERPCGYETGCTWWQLLAPAIEAGADYREACAEQTRIQAPARAKEVA